MEWSVRADQRTPGWTVRHRTSFHDALVIEVDARRIDDARLIADALIPSEEKKYAEVLIYVRSGDAVRRIQWTRRDGISELVINP